MPYFRQKYVIFLAKMVYSWQKYGIFLAKIWHIPDQNMAYSSKNMAYSRQKYGTFQTKTLHILAKTCHIPIFFTLYYKNERRN